jgi:hypothetical protein
VKSTLSQDWAMTSLSLASRAGMPGTDGAEHIPNEHVLKQILGIE